MRQQGDTPQSQTHQESGEIMVQDDGHGDVDGVVVCAVATRRRLKPHAIAHHRQQAGKASPTVNM